MSQQARLDTLVAEHRELFVEAAQRLKATGAWDLNTPVVVIDGREVPSTARIHPVGTLGSVLPTSAAIDSPELRRWLEICTEQGAEKAFDELLNSDDGEAFAEAYDQLRQERKEGIKGLWSASDLSRFVVKTREAHPQAVGAVAVLNTGGGQRHTVLTFESEVSKLLA